MKIQSKIIKSLSIVLLILPLQSFAELDATALNCAELENNSQRLNCFDQWIATAQTNKDSITNDDKALATAIDSTATTPAPLILSTNAASDKQLVVPSIPVKPLSTASSNEPTPQQLEQGFGLEHKRTQQETDTDHLTFTITKAKKTLREKWSLTFSNGQKWQTITPARVKFKVGEQVIITRGAFSSFSIKHLDSNRSVKIKRFQ